MEQSVDRRTFLSILGIGGLSVFLAPGFTRAAEKPPVAGALLRARIRTPPFRDSVVLLFEHGQRGTEGLIINKPDHRSLGRMMAQMNIRFRDRATFERYAKSELLYGGPVGRDQFLFLIHTPTGRWTPSWSLGMMGITPATPDVLRDLGAGTAGVKQVVACRGVSGWAPGQLEGEIAIGSWQVVYAAPEALPGLVFDTPACDRFDRARNLPEGRPRSIPRQSI
jgi:putative transcriptional regulator